MEILEIDTIGLQKFAEKNVANDRRKLLHCRPKKEKKIKLSAGDENSNE